MTDTSDPLSYRNTSAFDRHSGSGKFTNEPAKPSLNQPATSNETNVKSQAHHLIPNKLSRDASDFFDDLGDLYNHNDFDRNGVHLPESQALAHHLGAATHRGSHPAYNEFVSRILEEINAGYQADLNNNVNDAPEKAAEKVKKLQAYL